MVDGVLCITMAASADIKRSFTVRRRGWHFISYYLKQRQGKSAFLGEERLRSGRNHLLSPKVVQIHVSMCFPVLTTINSVLVFVLSGLPESVNFRFTGM